jgi:hypothetical protein
VGIKIVVESPALSNPIPCAIMFFIIYVALVLLVGTVALSSVKVMAVVAPSNFFAVIVVPVIENSDNADQI